MQPLCFNRIGDQLVHEGEIAGHNILGDGIGLTFREADFPQKIAITGHAIDIGAGNLGRPAFQRAAHPAGVDLAVALLRHQVDDGKPAAWAQDAKGFAQERFSSVEMKRRFQGNDAVDAGVIERQGGGRPVHVVDPRVGAMDPSMRQLRIRDIDGMDALRVSGLRQPQVLVAKSAAGIDHDVARADPRRVPQQVDHRLRRFAIIGCIAPVTEVQIGAIGRRAVARAHEFVT